MGRVKRDTEPDIEVRKTRAEYVGGELCFRFEFLTERCVKVKLRGGCSPDEMTASSREGRRNRLRQLSREQAEEPQPPTRSCGPSVVKNRHQATGVTAANALNRLTNNGRENRTARLGKRELQVFARRRRCERPGLSLGGRRLPLSSQLQVRMRLWDGGGHVDDTLSQGQEAEGAAEQEADSVTRGWREEGQTNHRQGVSFCLSLFRLRAWILTTPNLRLVGDVAFALVLFAGRLLSRAHLKFGTKMPPFHGPDVQGSEVAVLLKVGSRRL
ncbi:hypothetical protein AGIG_G18924 [Arapaima gigas]